jgi:DNA mismatch repair ATPase MutL
VSILKGGGEEDVYDNGCGMSDGEMKEMSYG